MNKWLPIAAFILILLAGIFLRVPGLAERPMHHDEANQAYRFGTLLENGTYTYDADDHHGPTLYYLTLPVAWLTGAKSFAETTEITYRLVPVLFGLLLILADGASPRGGRDVVTRRIAAVGIGEPQVDFFHLLPVATELNWKCRCTRRSLAVRHLAGDGLLQPLLHTGSLPCFFHLHGNSGRLAIY